MSSRGKKARGSTSVQPSCTRGSAPLVDTHDIASGVDLRYRPVIENDNPNPYSRDGMAQ
jgi:hypothetical protein